MKISAALVLFLCLMAAALPFAAAEDAPELYVEYGWYANVMYAWQQDGALSVMSVFGGNYGDEWISPEEMRLEARCDREGISFTTAMEDGILNVYVHGAEAADEFFYTVDVYYDAAGAHWESEPLDCLILPEEVKPIQAADPVADIGTGEGLDIPALCGALDKQWRTSPLEPFMLYLPFIDTADENWLLTYAVSSETVEFEASEPYCADGGLYAIDLHGFSGEGTIKVDYFLRYMQDGEAVFARRAGGFEITVAYWPIELMWETRNTEAAVGEGDITVGKLGAVCFYGERLAPEDYRITFASLNETAVCTATPCGDGTIDVALSGVERSGWVTFEICVELPENGMMRMFWYDIYCNDGRYIDYSMFASCSNYDPTVAFLRAIVQNDAELPLSDFDIGFTSSDPAVAYEWKEDGWVWMNTEPFTQDRTIDLRILVTHKETGEIWLDEQTVLDYRFISLPEVVGIQPADPEGYTMHIGEELIFAVPALADPQAAQEGWYIEVYCAGDPFTCTVEDGCAHIAGHRTGMNSLIMYLNNDRYAESVLLEEYAINIDRVVPKVASVPDVWPEETPVSIRKGETYALKKPAFCADGTLLDGWKFVLECCETQNFSVTEDDEYFYITALNASGEFSHVSLTLRHDDWYKVEQIASYTFRTASDALDFSLNVPQSIGAATGENGIKWFGSVNDICFDGEPLSPGEFEIYAYSDSENVDIFVRSDDELGLNRVLLYYEEALEGEDVIVTVNCFTTDREHFISKTFALSVR